MKTVYMTFQLSIHDLTRRSTPVHSIPGLDRISFNSRPHKEVDRVYSDSRTSRCPFNSRPHKEVDTCLTRSQEQSDPFNSRPHKEVDAMMQRVRLGEIFQFTTSQGGRLSPLCGDGKHVVFQFTTSQGGRLALVSFST